MREWTEIGFSSIYYVLNRLENAGWLESGETEMGEPSETGVVTAPAGFHPMVDHRAAPRRAGPARKVYHLTAAGWAGYQAAVHERLARPRPHTGDFDLALANLPALPPEETRAALESFRDFLQERLDRVRAKWAMDRSSAEQAGQPLPPHVDALFDYSIARISAELAWVLKYLGT